MDTHLPSVVTPSESSKSYCVQREKQYYAFVKFKIQPRPNQDPDIVINTVYSTNEPHQREHWWHDGIPEYKSYHGLYGAYLNHVTWKISWRLVDGDFSINRDKYYLGMVLSTG